jgi:hypothetical protein
MFLGSTRLFGLVRSPVMDSIPAFILTRRIPILKLVRNPEHKVSVPLNLAFRKTSMLA